MVGKVFTNLYSKLYSKVKNSFVEYHTFNCLSLGKTGKGGTWGSADFAHIWNKRCPNSKYGRNRLNPMFHLCLVFPETDS